MPLPRESLAWPTAAQSVPMQILALEVLGDLRDWTSRHGECFTTGYLETTAMAHAFSAPWSAAQDLAPATRMSVWLFTVDDLMDKQLTELSEVEELIEMYITTLDGTIPASPDPLCQALSELSLHLQKGPLYPAIGPLWHRAIRELLAIWRWEWLAAREDPGSAGAPTLDQYLGNADSVAIRPILLANWIWTGAPDLPWYLAVLTTALAECASAIRLANDLATGPREQAEGHVLNALALGASPDWVRTRIRHHASRFHAAIRPLTAAAIPSAIAFARLTDWLQLFYQHSDLRRTGLG